MAIAFRVSAITTGDIGENERSHLQNPQRGLSAISAVIYEGAILRHNSVHF